MGLFVVTVFRVISLVIMVAAVYALFLLIVWLRRSLNDPTHWGNPVPRDSLSPPEKEKEGSHGARDTFKPTRTADTNW